MKNILTIDDDVIITETISSQLSSIGLQSLKAYSGDMGLKIAESENPDLIILDLNMPGMSGFDVLKKLQQNEKTRDIPVILLTSNSSKHNVIQARRYNIIDYVLKPHSFQSLTKRFHVAAEKNKQSLSNRKPVPKNSLAITRGERKTTISFCTDLTESARQEAQRVLGPTFRHLTKHDDIILDIRSINNLTDKNIFFLEKLLIKFDLEKIYMTAGKNFSIMRYKALSFPKDRIFSSLGEVTSIIDRLNS